MKKLVLVLLIGILLLSACSNNARSEIVGEWRSPDGSTNIEFFDDGTAFLESREVALELRYSFIEDNRFRLESDAIEEIWEIEATDETLRITSQGGRNFTKIQIVDMRYARRILPDLLDGLQLTVLATFLGFGLALIFGFGFALGRRSKQIWISLPSAAVVEFTRSTPLLVQLFFFFFVLPKWGIRLPAFQLGVIAIGLHYGTYCSEVYRAGIDAVPQGQWEASTALNFSARRVWLGIILPQAIPPMIPAFGNYFVAMFKETAQLSAITVVELLLSARSAGTRDFRFLEPITMAGGLYFAVSYPSSLIVQQLEKRFGRQK
jgi:polar amino acid transport system permease protein